ncbi:MAG: transcriptional repressor [Chromatiales bacterium]|jgi:Fur family iron response transcriptional regulator|nr:transcriptional repressor [Chromatiales bacterium]
MDPAIDVQAKLEAHGVNPTPQRLEIGALLLRQPVHLSADQILQQLRAAGSAVSKATVYNTLRLFTAHGLVREVAVDPGRAIYDSTTVPHHHFYNADTGELTDIDAGAVGLPGIPSLPAGTRAESVEVIVRLRSR